jgi:hypothetical protein
MLPERAVYRVRVYNEGNAISCDSGFAEVFVMATHSLSPERSELGQRAQELYERLRPQIETPENLGKLIVMDVESGEYEIDELGIETSRRLHQRHPGASLYALRIGYKAVEALGGILERTGS